MARSTVFVKVSGDICTDQKFIELIRELSREKFVVICVGGGTQIKAAFKEAGFPEADYGPLGRKTSSFAERQLARNVLECNQLKLQDALADQGVVATVIIPVLDIGSVLCHVNGDQMLKTAYLGFDELIVVTLAHREQDKTAQFTELEKISIVTI